MRRGQCGLIRIAPPQVVLQSCTSVRQMGNGILAMSTSASDVSAASSYMPVYDNYLHVRLLPNNLMSCMCKVPQALHLLLVLFIAKCTIAELQLDNAFCNGTKERKIPSRCNSFPNVSSSTATIHLIKCKNGTWDLPDIDLCRCTCNLSSLRTPKGITIVEANQTIFQVGDKVSLQCEEEGKVISGRKTAKCAQDGIWRLGERLTCRRKTTSHTRGSKVGGQQI